MLTKRCLCAGLLALLGASVALAAPAAVNPVTGQPLVITCYKGTPDAIDGDLSDWNLDAMTPAVLDASAQIYTGQTTWTGPADCSGKFYTQWDDKYIYFGVIVKDDTIVTNKSNGDIWNADCVEVFLGTTNWGTSATDHTQHYQWGFNANGQYWNWCNMDSGGQTLPTYMKVASKKVPGGYVCEVALEWAQIKALKFTPGTTLGFHPCIDDTDATDRELQITWTGREAHDQSLGFGYLLLSPDPAMPKGVSRAPSPSNKAADVPVDTVLSWTAGKYAATHDVYLGTSLTDVNSASRTAAAGVLVSQGQTATSYAPAKPLAFGTTYYWRVDEVNQAPDGTIYKGVVWSFTTETYGVPVTPAAATASSAQPGMGPENTINGSGLDALDQHGNDGATMWLSLGTAPNWIQYQFDKVYKLYDLKVWNSNQSMEPFIGFGAKDVKIEYSADGTTWATLANVPPFARASGLPGYAANTTVSLGGVMAKYVKLTINTTWGGMSPATGLSEVRFSYVPVQARAPQPANAATSQSLTTTLSWRAGRDEVSHKVFFGTDQAAVTNGTAPAQTVTAHTFNPGTLNYGTTYYWRVDEVNATTYPGDVWSFTTQEFAVVDDFESYDQDANRLYDTWIDGSSDGLSGSYVGYNPTAAQLAAGATFAETVIIHGGAQSMPMAYDNTKTPFYSEATRTFAAPQDWTGNGADTLSLWYRGYGAVTSATMNVNAAGTAMSLTGAGTDIWGTSDQFSFAYKTLTGDGTVVARVTDKGTGSNTWAKGGVMIRQSVNSNSAFAAMVLSANSDGTASNGYSYQRRTATGGSASSDDGTAPALNVPYYVKVQRAGDNFTAWVSADGKSWRQQGTTQTIAMTGPVCIGICVTSHAAGENRTMQFDNIATTGNVSGSWQGAVINAIQYNSPAGLYVVVTDSSAKSKVVAHPDPAAAATATWTQWKVALSEAIAAGVKTNKVQKLTIGVGNKTAPAASGTGMLYLDDIGYGHPAK